jgi:UDP-GlcNAc:undecaprenyl-phosphate/decaprenyl-phosphate GlcNAc-1-phosphate transferase
MPLNLDPFQYVNWLWPLAMTALFIPLWAKWVSLKNVTAVQDFRRQGAAGVPLMGGVPIAVTFFIAAFWFGGDLSRLIALSAIPLLVIAAYDDIRQVSARTKFMGQMLTVGLFISMVPGEFLLLHRIGIPSPIAQFLTAFWMLGMINAVNMIDGMDGEAGGFAVVVGIALYCMFRGDPHALVLAVLISSSLGFLIYNFQPAQIYLGDVGSGFLGLALAASAACLPIQNPNVIHAIVPLMLFSFAEIDAVRSMYRRWHSRTPLTQGDHQHLHHKLLKLDLSVREAWVVLMSVISVSCLAALGIFLHHSPTSQLLIFVLALFGLMGQLLWLDYSHHLVTKRISNFSSSLLSKFLELNLDSSFVDSSHHLTIYDLMPYYKELQQHGIKGVTFFLEDFAKFVKKHHSAAVHVSMIGQASIVVADPGPADSEAQAALVKTYFALIDQHKVRLNDSKKPWGLHFPRAESRMAKEVYKMILTHRDAGELKLIRKAS